jgi:hypothetical protein
LFSQLLASYVSMRLYAAETCTSDVEIEVKVPFGQKPGPAGSAVAQRQRSGKDTAIAFKDMATAGQCTRYKLYGSTKAI